MEKQLGYVVERIVSSEKQEICYDGPLTIENLPAHLCPPLSLKHLDVVQIKPKPTFDVFTGQETQRMRAKRKEEVVICLICHVTDRYGFCAEGTANIVVEACAAPCKGNLRRGATVELIRACFCGACVFEIQAVVRLQTVVSCCELFAPAKLCTQICKQLPLYPPSPHDKRCKTQ